MNGAGDRQIEHAEAMVALEGAMAVQGVRASLARPGRPDCADCGDDIDPDRRAALPSAQRCAGCEGRRELKRKRGW